MEHKYTNRLINEKSPYLLQHAHNPVDWYSWGDEAFEKAKREDKPVFLSIGYSTCHWCHVMERESFESEEVARALNEGFVAIKVDREERPDIDQVYMAVAQSLTGSGGWPLTVFLTPDRKPFYAGTYFPKESRQGLPGLLDILELFRKKWLTERQAFDMAGEDIKDGLQSSFQRLKPGDPDAELLDRAFEQLSGRFDPKYGGFGNAPKFPSPHQLLFLLRYWKRTGDQRPLELVETTLQAMYCGGIYDHVGFGFSRYSTDRYWLAPHFEKMLYDNALLAIAYLEAYQATRNSFYAGVARNILSYVLRDMTSPDGVFYSAEDADSEGEEGRFYLWTPEQVKQALGDEQGEFFNYFYDITDAGNFEGRNIPNLVRRRHELFGHGGSPGAPASSGQVTDPIVDGRLIEARRMLFAAREARVHPYKDDKVLTAWNGLMIVALARAGWVLDDRECADAAARAARFLLSHLRQLDAEGVRNGTVAPASAFEAAPGCERASGRLLARYRDGQAAIPAYLDDYAFLTWGLIELYGTASDPFWLEQALALNQQMLELFRDEQNGGFFFTGSDAETLSARPKEIYDGAMPSGNAVAALNLLRLARLTGDPGLDTQAESQLSALAGTVASYPAGHAFYLCALAFALDDSVEIAIAGKRDAADTNALLSVLRDSYLPVGAMVLFKPTGEEGNRELGDNRAAAYVCRHHACLAPVTDPGALIRLLS